MSTTSNTQSMGTTNPGDRSAAEIEREVEQTRARLTGTVEELKDRVSPGTLAEQGMEWLRGSGGRQFLDNLGGTLRDNPVPVVLIAAGIGWLAMGGRGEGRANRRWREHDPYEDASPIGYGAYPGESYPPEAYAGDAARGTSESSSFGTGMHDAASGIGERASQLRRSAGETVHDLRDRAGSMAERAGQAASNAWDSVAGAAEQVWDSATGAANAAASGAGYAGRRVAGGARRGWSAAADTASGLGRGAYRMGDRTGRRLADTVEEQPLLLGAFGLAIGAAIGALLPSSTAEDRLMGESRDRVADRLSAMAGEAYDKAKETAGEHLGDVQERVSGGAQALGEVARDLRETVERTAQDVGGAARAEIDRTEGGSADRAGEKPTGTGAPPSTYPTAKPAAGSTGTGNAPPDRTTGGPRIGPV